MVTVFVFLAICATVTAILNAMARCPLWVSVILLCLIELIRALPLGK
jgi:hypothetical protein